jgi:thiamine monophosphate synthase
VVEGVKLPVFALGGITPARVPECLTAGAFGVAVMSGVMSPKGAGIQAKHYLYNLESVKEIQHISPFEN